METFTAYQPFHLVLYKRRISQHPRLYLKDETHYRYTRMFLTKRGFASVAFLTITGLSLATIATFFLR